MLFAPKAGAETRQLIKDKTGEGSDYLKQRGSDLKDSAGDLLNKSKDALNRQKDTITDAMEAGKQAYRDAVNQAPPLPTDGPAH
jgi:gas vesicle protein